MGTGKMGELKFYSSFTLAELQIQTLSNSVLKRQLDQKLSLTQSWHTFRRCDVHAKTWSANASSQSSAC